MTAPFRQILAYSSALAGGVFISLWFIFMVLGFGREQLPVATAVVDTPAPAVSPTMTPALSKLQPTPAETPIVAPSAPEPQPAPGRSDIPGPLVAKMQRALLKNGYSVGKAGDDGNFNDETLAALAAFQSNNALAVQPSCDEQCWNALGFSDQK